MCVCACVCVFRQVDLDTKSEEASTKGEEVVVIVAALADLDEKFNKCEKALEVSEATVNALMTQIAIASSTNEDQKSEVALLRQASSNLEAKYVASEQASQQFESELLGKIKLIQAAHEANVEAVRSGLQRQNDELAQQLHQMTDDCESNKVAFEALAVEQIAAEETQAKQTAKLAALETELETKSSDLQQTNEWLEETTTHISYLKGQVERLQVALDGARETLEPFVSKGLVQAIRIVPINQALPSDIKEIQLSIPSVVLKTDDGTQYHAYEIHVVASDESWKVYRRYSELLALHKEVLPRVRGSQCLIFPPKRTFGTKSDKVVEERRLLLQEYLTMLLRLCIGDPRSPLHSETTKTALLVALPFFAEETIAMTPLDADDKFM